MRALHAFSKKKERCFLNLLMNDAIISEQLGPDL